jgi:hypothetical protein
MSERSKDLRVSGNASCVRPQIVQRPHLITSTPDVPAHRHDHLGIVSDPADSRTLTVDLGAAVDEQRDLFAELVSQLVA